MCDRVLFSLSSFFNFFQNKGLPPMGNEGSSPRSPRKSDEPLIDLGSTLLISGQLGLQRPTPDIRGQYVFQRAWESQWVELYESGHLLVRSSRDSTQKPRVHVVKEYTMGNLAAAAVSKDYDWMLSFSPRGAGQSTHVGFSNPYKHMFRVG